MNVIFSVPTYWEDLGNYLQIKWELYLDTIGEDPIVLWIYSPCLITIIVYWSVGIIYTLLDIYNKPDAVRRYKVQPGTNEPVDMKKLIKVCTSCFCFKNSILIDKICAQVIKQVIVNQTVITIPTLYVIYKLIEMRGIYSYRELPTLKNVAIELGIHTLLQEVGFYYSHRYFI